MVPEIRAGFQRGIHVDATGPTFFARCMIEQYCYVTPLTALVECILQWQEKQQQIDLDLWVATQLRSCGGVWWGVVGSKELRPLRLL